MPTLLQCIDELIDNISVTDRQEEYISRSVANLDSNLKNEDNNLFVKGTYTNGSYERDTIIRPLDDVDIFAVLDKSSWQDDLGNLPNPQNVLTKIKNYLNGLHDYADKVSQSRPCVTIHLSDKDFDVLPSFENFIGGYYIPGPDLKSWIHSNPKKLTDDLNSTHRNCNYKLKPTIKVVKYWNKLNDKVIPSFHIEETAIEIFKINDFHNYEESIRIWFNNAEYYLYSSKFKSNDDYNLTINKIKNVKEQLNKAKYWLDENKGAEAVKIWKEIFKKEFPTVDMEEAKKFSKSLTDGSLKISSAGILSTEIGRIIPKSGGFYGEISRGEEL